MEKASIFRRISSGFVNYLIFLIFVFLIFIFFGYEDSNGEIVVSFHHGLLIMIFWPLFNILSEYFFGRTIGNYIVSIKPISLIDEESKLTFTQVFKRHFIYWIDFSIVGLILLVATEKKQRLGDIWAKTIVVKEFKKKEFW